VLFGEGWDEDWQGADRVEVVEVAFLHQSFLEARLDAFTKKRTARQHHGSVAGWLQQADDEGEKKVSRFASLDVFGEVALADAVFFLATKGRVREDTPVLLHIFEDIVRSALKSWWSSLRGKAATP